MNLIKLTFYKITKYFVTFLETKSKTAISVNSQKVVHMAKIIDKTQKWR